GRRAELGYIAGCCLNSEPSEINSTKNDACASSRRQNPQMHRSSAMQTDAFTLYRHTNCLFERQVILFEQITPRGRSCIVVFLQQFCRLRLNHFLCGLKSSLGVTKSASARWLL